MFIIGVDLGGTQIRAGLFKESGELVERKAILTNADEGPTAVINRLKALIYEISEPVIQKSGKQSLIGIGIGCPGPLDVFKGIIKSPPNLPGWVDIPLKQYLEEEFQIPVYLNNDANAAVLGEYFFGSGKGNENLVYLTLSTGVGTGIIDNGQLLLGQNGSSAEVGHMSLNPKGPLCGCGNNGCFEAYLSGTGIVNRTKVRLEQNTNPSSLREVKLTTKEVFEASKKGDRLALEIVQETKDYLGVALVNVIHLYNPSMIIFGGGVSQVGAFLLEQPIQFAKERVMKPMAEQLVFGITELGDDVGLIGAASLVKYHNQQRE
jgi:glucokinase